MIGARIIHTKLMTVENDGHYPGSLINGGRLLDYFGDVGTELMIRATGSGSMFRAYKEVQFLAPVHIGDFMEYHAWLEKKGRTSYEVHFEAWKTITRTDDYKISHQYGHGVTGEPDLKGYEGSILLDPPLLCGTAIGIMVVPEEEQMPAPDPRFRALNEGGTEEAKS